TTENLTGIYEQVQVEQLNIFPNPSGGTARLSFHSRSKGHVKVIVSDITGRQFATIFDGIMMIGNQELLIPAMPSGIHLLKMETRTGVLVRRFVKL
ncbi:MAG: hypothetical protein COB85_07505, partial [Bacteroidetes bacterium]